MQQPNSRDHYINKILKFSKKSGHTFDLFPLPHRTIAHFASQKREKIGNFLKGRSFELLGGRSDRNRSHCLGIHGKHFYLGWGEPWLFPEIIEFAKITLLEKKIKMRNNYLRTAKYLTTLIWGATSTRVQCKLYTLEVIYFGRNVTSKRSDNITL